MEHLSFDDYLAALQGGIDFSVLDQQAHRHLVDICGDCRSEWQVRLGCEQPTSVSAAGEELPVPPPLSSDGRQISLDALGVVEQLLAQSREARRFARDDLHRLLRLPLERWARRVARARTRFRSRAFAELLIEESRRRVRTAPSEAASLAALVPIALSRPGSSLDRPWAEVLVARAAAHRANALRVAGDLPAAEAAFADLRLASESRRLPLPQAEAEIDSLEASLRFDQRNFERAEGLLASAASVYYRTSDGEGLLRTLIKRSNLLRTMDRPDQALTELGRTTQLLDKTDDTYLQFCVVNGRVNTLLDLDRPRDAEGILTTERATYVDSGDDYTVALHRFMQARIDLGLGRLADSVTGFEATRDQFLALDRDYDAVLASLYLADALLAAGRMADLRRLAAELVPLFHARGVERETLASLRLFAQAVEAETVTAALLAQLRRSLHPASAAAPSLVPDG